MCAPENSGEVVRELSQHPSVLADVLSLAAASDGAKQAAAREVSYHGAGKAPCIETLSKESPCPVPVEGYQVMSSERRYMGYEGLRERNRLFTSMKVYIVIVIV